MDAWRSIPNYPEWFKFYGEENFASFQLFKKGWEIHYLPNILINHRVENIQRQKNDDFYIRRVNALKADWLNIMLFYPFRSAFRLILYSISKQTRKGQERERSKNVADYF